MMRSRVATIRTDVPLDINLIDAQFPTFGSVVKAFGLGFTA